ncbi:hypothetical protein E2562_017584 [Oryza meyeriana var. granulata]|uniref:Uncharacterized protein n=1 Tax=Oryza meyeriana var. granulata TaxID=110450 RepID=A0A6G1BLV1_9ORYZ|nr:hypothetical protein E2562_017584 [Oryza meyeriana var. granulata]
MANLGLSGVRRECGVAWGRLSPLLVVGEGSPGTGSVQQGRRVTVGGWRSSKGVAHRDLGE